MPTYTYHCDNCGIRFDQYQKFLDEPLTICPECGEVSLRKVFQPVGIVFKGSGFYATDHRSPSGAPSTHSKNETSPDGKPDNAKTAEKTPPATEKGHESKTAE